MHSEISPGSGTMMRSWLLIELVIYNWLVKSATASKLENDVSPLWCVCFRPQTQRVFLCQFLELGSCLWGHSVWGSELGQHGRLILWPPVSQHRGTSESQHIPSAFGLWVQPETWHANSSSVKGSKAHAHISSFSVHLSVPEQFWVISLTWCLDPKSDK